MAVAATRRESREATLVDADLTRRGVPRTAGAAPTRPGGRGRGRARARVSRRALGWEPALGRVGALVETRVTARIAPAPRWMTLGFFRLGREGRGGATPGMAIESRAHRTWRRPRRDRRSRVHERRVWDAPPRRRRSRRRAAAGGVRRRDAQEAPLGRKGGDFCRAGRGCRRVRGAGGARKLTGGASVRDAGRGGADFTGKGDG